MGGFGGSTTGWRALAIAAAVASCRSSRPGAAGSLAARVLVAGVCQAAVLPVNQSRQR